VHFVGGDDDHDDDDDDEDDDEGALMQLGLFGHLFHIFSKLCFSWGRTD